MTLTPRIARYDQVLLDLDGCLWVGDEALEGAPEAVAALRDAGKAVAFLTNDVRHAPEEFVRKLWRLGFQAALSEVVTVGATIQYLLTERNGGAAFVVGTQALVDHVAEAGMRIVNRTEFASRADVVVVGAHEALTYEELRIAAQAVIRGAELIGATRDATFPMPDGPWPATGAVLAAVETAAGPHGRPGRGQAGAGDVRGRARPARRGPLHRRRRPAGDRRARRAPRRDGLRARAHGRRHPHAGRGRGPEAHPRRGVARGAGASVETARRWTATSA